MFAVLDTNHLREYIHGTSAGDALRSRIQARDADVFTSIVAVEESVGGWLAYVRRHKAGLNQLQGYERLHDCISALGKLTILPFDRESALIFHELERQRLRVGTMDLKIAAICMAHDALLLSRNIVDFVKVPGLRVENWLD